MTPVAGLDCATNERISGTSAPSSTGAAAGNRRSADTPITVTTVEMACRNDDREKRGRHTVRRRDDDREEPQRGQAGLVDRAQVVAAVQEQRGGAHVLRGLDDGSRAGSEGAFSSPMLSKSSSANGAKARSRPCGAPAPP